MGCSGIELAPDKIWARPLQSSLNDRLSIRHAIESHGLELIGFHALLYTRQELKLFDSKNSFIRTSNYLSSLASLCAEMGGKNLIFGSPSNRSLCGRPYQECYNQAILGFRELAKVCKSHGINFCIEPLPSSQNQFITSASEGENLVKHVNHPNFCLHLDASALRQEAYPPNSIIEDTITPEHFHVNDPGLTVPGSSTNDLPLMIEALRKKNYNGYLSIEVVSDNCNSLQRLKSSIEYVQRQLERN